VTRAGRCGNARRTDSAESSVPRSVTSRTPPSSAMMGRPTRRGTERRRRSAIDAGPIRMCHWRAALGRHREPREVCAAPRGSPRALIHRTDTAGSPWRLKCTKARTPAAVTTVAAAASRTSAEGIWALRGRGCDCAERASKQGDSHCTGRRARQPGGRAAASSAGRTIRAQSTTKQDGQQHARRQPPQAHDERRMTTPQGLDCGSTGPIPSGVDAGHTTTRGRPDAHAAQCWARSGVRQALRCSRAQPSSAGRLHSERPFPRATALRAPTARRLPATAALRTAFQAEASAPRLAPPRRAGTLPSH